MKLGKIALSKKVHVIQVYFPPPKAWALGLCEVAGSVELVGEAEKITCAKCLQKINKGLKR
jgi:hypothetical protein